MGWTKVRVPVAMFEEFSSNAQANVPFAFMYGFQQFQVLTSADLKVTKRPSTINARIGAIDLFRKRRLYAR